MRVLHFILGLLLLTGADACSDDPQDPGPADTTITDYTYRVVSSYPHDTGAFTEGLVWDNGTLLEGTGYFGGPSQLRRVELITGDVLQFREAPFRAGNPIPVFGEGITRVENRIVQLTWTDQVAWVYDASTLDSIGMFTYIPEGWGLTHDGTRFIASDGTSTLYFRDLDTFAEIGRVTVRDEDGPVTQLNELEFIDGRVWANVFESPLIVMIDPDTGRVRGRLDLTGLIMAPPDVANGIAHDPAGDRLFVTGKLWPLLFEIDIVETAAP